MQQKIEKTRRSKKSGSERAAKRVRRAGRLQLESLKARELLTAQPIVTSADGLVTIGADFFSSEVHSQGWADTFTDMTVNSPLPVENGYPRTEDDRTSLSGTANAADTVSVTVGGRLATWSAGDGTWSLDDIPLNPGINRIHVRAFDGPNGTGSQVDGHYIDVWYDTGSSTNTDLRIPFGSTWEYLDDGTDQGTAWRTSDPDPPWPTGPAQLGYGDGDEATVVDDGPANDPYTTTYFRHTFNVPAGQAEVYNQIVIDLLYDDGAAVYINGTEVVRTGNLPGTIGDNAVQYDTLADFNGAGTEENERRQFVLPEQVVSGLLQDGENIIAAEVHQHDAGSSDLSFDLALTASQVTAFTIPMGSTWEYLDDGSDQGTAWRTSEPNPPWPTGPAQLGYGDGDEATVVDRGPTGDRHVSTYFRHKFDLTAGEATMYGQIEIDLLYDDGAAVYINDVEVVRTGNLPGTLGDDSVRYDTLADFNGAGTEENELRRFIVPPQLVAGLLQDGENVIAVEVHQHDLGSSDMSFDLGLTASVGGPQGIQTVAGVLPTGTTTWAAEDGPFLIASDVTVPVGGTLVIEPGTTVYLADSQSLNVLGQLTAEGTANEIIRFTRRPGTNDVSSGIQFSDTTGDNRIRYAVLEWGGTSGNEGLVGLDDSRLTLDHVTLDHAERRRIRSIDSSLVVRNSVFADIFGPDDPPTTDNISEHIWGRNPPPDGEWIVENNIFGLAKGHNDVIDFDAEVRPDAIPQILNNTFIGGGDDAMDFEGDVHIEGNLIQNFIKDEWNTGSGNANAISAGVGRHYVMSRNIFKNVEQVAQVKQDAFLTFVNNTVVDVSVSAIYFQRPTGGEFGRGAYVDGNIFYNTPVILDEFNETTEITMNNSVGNEVENTFGTGNIVGDPMLADPGNFDFNLLASSPAIGTGPNDVDMGALIPAGATISGEPPLITIETSATLAIGGPDIYAYRFRLDAGPWSDPVEVTAPGTKDQVISPVQLDGLQPGSHFVEVVARDSAGVWQSDSEATVSGAWTIPSNLEPELTLITRDSYLSDVGLLVRVEVSDETGNPDRDLWDGVMTLTSDNPNVTLSNNQVTLHNGLGSVLLTVEGTEDFRLSASYGDLQDSRSLENLDDVVPTIVSGAFTGDQTIWSGVVHVTDDVTIPVGHTLNIEPGTLILVDGTSATLDENGIDIIVNGALNSQGTLAQPVTFTAADMNAPWGEINHSGADPSSYSYTAITRAGHAGRGGHTNTGPAIRSTNSDIIFEHSSITDIAGKIMQANGSELVFDDALLSRAVMGPEIDNSSLLLINSYMIDMLGIYHEGGVTDDNDGFYIHSQAAGQSARIANSVVSHVDDDGIDTLGADIVIENVIIRDANTNDGSKGISFLEGNHIVRHTLLVNTYTGVSLKAQAGGGVSGHVQMDHVTIADTEVGVFAEDKFGIPDAILTYDISNSIIRANDALGTDYDPVDIHVRYSDVSEAWPGVGNINADPLFVDAANHDYHLAADSAAIDAGDPNAPLDADGTRTDMGVFPNLRFADFDGNGLINAADIDLLCAATMVEFPDPSFDLNGNGDVNAADLTVLIEDILRTRFGDADLNGVVNGDDFMAWSTNRFTSGKGWAAANFNCDGVTDVSDFNVWNVNKFATGELTEAATPSMRVPRAAGTAFAEPVLPVSDELRSETTVLDHRRTESMPEGRRAEHQFIDAAIAGDHAWVAESFAESFTTKGNLKRFRTPVQQRRLGSERPDGGRESAMDQVLAELIRVGRITSPHGA